MAKLYKEHGLKVEGSHRENQIINKLANVLGLSTFRIGTYLSDDYKQKATHIQRDPIVPASERIANLGGVQLVERFRKEVLEEAKLSPEELAKRKEKREADKKHRAEKRKQLEEEKIKKQVDEEITKRTASASFPILVEKPKVVQRDVESLAEMQSRASKIANEIVNGVAPKLSELSSLPIRPKVNDLDCYMFISSIIKSLNSGQIFCPDHRDQKTDLIFSCCGLSLKDAQKKLSAGLGRD